MKVILCADLTEKSLAELKTFANTPYHEKATEIHVTHCFETKVYAAEFYANYFPSEDQFPEIEKSVKDLLKNSLHQTLSLKNNNGVQYHCLFSGNSKNSLINFSLELKADLIVVATRSLTGVKGAFSTSFADYILRHSTCPVLILK